MKKTYVMSAAPRDIQNSAMATNMPEKPAARRENGDAMAVRNAKASNTRARR